MSKTIDELEIEDVIKLGINAGINYIKQQEELKIGKRKDRRLRNTKLLLKIYRTLKKHIGISDITLSSLKDEQITTEQALDNSIKPLREFMLNQVREDDLRLFMDIAKMDTVDRIDEIPITVVIPAFIIGELRAAFIIGFLIYIPFIVIDMVVASVLMSMGMMMLPPTTISMPFKILLFVLADGWSLIVGQLVASFNF